MKRCLRCNSEHHSHHSQSDFHNIYKCLNCNYLTPTIIEECCRNPFLNVTIDDKNQERKRLHRQCLNCGGCVDRNRPLSFKKYADEIRLEFSYLNYNNWLSNRGSQTTSLWESVKNENYESSRYLKYSNYLKSENWKLKRSEVLKRDKDLCQVCKENKAFEVHHITYENLFKEKLEDLLSVCRNCHIEIHRQKDEEEKREILKKINEH